MDGQLLTPPRRGRIAGAHVAALCSMLIIIPTVTIVTFLRLLRMERRLEGFAKEGPFEVQFVKLRPDARAPQRCSEQAVGYDVYAAEEVSVPPGGESSVDLGIALHTGHLDSHIYAQIHGRSGLAFRQQVQVFPGVIDPDSIGGIRVLLKNGGQTHFQVHPGDRIAQLVFLRYATAQLQEISKDCLKNTSRGTGAFGSTGIR